MKAFVLLSIVGVCLAEYGHGPGGYAAGPARPHFSGYPTNGFSGDVNRAGVYASGAAGYPTEHGNFLSRSTGGFSPVTPRYPSGRAGGFAAGPTGYPSGTAARTNGYNALNRYAGHGENYDNSEPARYDFKYDVNDPHNGVDFGHQEQKDGDFSQGSYYVLLPDGRKQLVEYTTDVDGYHPRISYEDVSATTRNYGQGGFGNSGNYRQGDYTTGGYQYNPDSFSRNGPTGYQNRRSNNQVGY